MSYSRKVTYTTTSSEWSSNGERTVTVTHRSCNGKGEEWDLFPQLKQFQQQHPTVFRQIVQQKATPEVTQNSRSNGGTASNTSSSFEAAVLAEHNRLRAKHSAAPLTLNPAISQYAQEWANNLASRNVMQHRSNNRYGENLYACFGKTNVSGEEAVISWYNEIKDYRFGQASPSPGPVVGHFTQVVWKSSKQLGVGIARNGNNVYVVCNYDPPGNFMGQYAANVTRS